MCHGDVDCCHKVTLKGETMDEASTKNELFWLICSVVWINLLGNIICLLSICLVGVLCDSQLYIQYNVIQQEKEKGERDDKGFGEVNMEMRKFGLIPHYYFFFKIILQS